MSGLTAGIAVRTAGRIEVSATPENYTAAHPNVEAHLAGVDAALGLLITRRVVINSLVDFPTPAQDGSITLEANVLYILNAMIYVPDPYHFVIPAYGYAVIQQEANGCGIVYLGTGALFSGTTINSLSFKSCYIVSNGTGQLFNLVGGGAPTFSLISSNFSSFGGWPSLGALDTCAVLFTETVFMQCAFGLAINNAPLVGIRTCTFIDWLDYGGTFLTFGGNVANAQVNDNIVSPKATEYFLNLGQSFTYGISISGNLNNTPGRFFNPSGLNHAAPLVTCQANSNVPNSAVFGSLAWLGNTAETVITDVGNDLGILSFTDAGGGLVTVTTSAAHSYINGETVWIFNTANYNGAYLISNATGSTLTITNAFQGTETGRATYGWKKVSGTTYPVENERCSMSANNRLSFTTLEDTVKKISLSLDVVRGAGSGAPTMDFTMFKNGMPVISGANVLFASGDTDNVTPIAIVLNWAMTVRNGDYVEVWCRNVYNTSAILVKNGQLMI